MFYQVHQVAPQGAKLLSSILAELLKLTPFLSNKW